MSYQQVTAWIVVCDHPGCGYDTPPAAHLEGASVNAMLNGLAETADGRHYCARHREDAASERPHRVPRQRRER